MPNRRTRSLVSRPKLLQSKELQLAGALCLMAAAFGAGRQTGILNAGSQESPAPGAKVDAMPPREVAEQVSRALQLASSEAAQSVVQVRSYRTSRRGGMRPHQEGSGVVISADGLIVTNHHVVTDGARFDIVFTDGTKGSAKLLGSDDSIDLAVLQLNDLTHAPGGKPLRPMPLRTELPPVGELVLAVGNPLSLGHTVTLGVVNGLGRSNLDIAQYENYIQTDAAINPGNSGGPLVDVQGRAIGITVAVGLKSNGDGGLAFAIPAAMVQRVVDDIVEHGRVRRAYLGVSIAYASERSVRTARAEGYTGTSLVKVNRITTDTPAAQAGLRQNDILLKFGKRALTGNQSFENALIEADPGDTVEVKIWRSGNELTKSVTLSER